jgi:hypothetical protein
MMFLIIVIATTKHLLDVKHRHDVFDKHGSHRTLPVIGSLITMVGGKN